MNLSKFDLYARIVAGAYAPSIFFIVSNSISFGMMLLISLILTNIILIYDILNIKKSQ